MAELTIQSWKDPNPRNRIWMANAENKAFHAIATSEGLQKSEVREHLSNIRKGKRQSPQTEFKKGVRSPRFIPIGARILRKSNDLKGYWIIKIAETGDYTKDWRPEHQIKAEEKLGRPLRKGEVVHHVNFDKGNNSLDNIYIADSNSKHRKLHQFEKLVRSFLDRGLVKFDFEIGEYYVC